jgi:hypothetical protein
MKFQSGEVLPFKTIFFVCAITKWFVRRATASTESSYIIFPDQISGCLFYGNVSINKQRAIGHSLHNCFGLYLHLITGFTIQIITQRPGWTLFDLGDDLICGCTFGCNPWPFFWIEHRAKSFKTEGRVNAKVGLPNNGHFSIRILLRDILHYSNILTLPFQRSPDTLV